MEQRERLRAQKTFMKDNGEMNTEKMAETIGHFRNLTKEGLDKIISNEFRLNKFVQDITTDLEEQKLKEQENNRYKGTALEDLITEIFMDEYIKPEFKYTMLALTSYNQEQNVPKKEDVMLNIILGKSNAMVAEHKIIEGSDEIRFNLAAIYMLTNLGAGPHFGNDVTRRQAAGILE